MQIFENKKGFTLVEAIIGVALLMIVFSGIYGAYRLSLKIVGLSKDKVVATGIANSQIEKIRNLPYASVGTLNAVLPKASGTLDPVATKNIDGENFTITTTIQYISDPTDGTYATNPPDPCDLDYKDAMVAVSWGGAYAGSISISTIVAPKSLVEETQGCQSQPGGVITATVFDSQGLLVLSPTISVYDVGGTVLIATATPTSGIYSFPLPVGTYRVVATKNGYSTARSYGNNEVATPNVVNPSVILNGNTPVSLSIDKVAMVGIDAISPTGQDSFADSFNDQSKVSMLSSTEVASGSVVLAGSPHAGKGSVISSPIAPPNIVSWGSFNFSNTVLDHTKITYHILYFNGSDWDLIPEYDLGGNSSGFDTSPVDLSVLNKNTYPQLEIEGKLKTDDPDITPSIDSWQISWTTNEGVPIPGATFHMQGGKDIGKDSSGQKVFKYVNDYTTDGSGHLDLPNTEWDTYTFSSNTANMNLVSTDPAPQPVGVAPASVVAVKLYFMSTRSLWVTTQDDSSLLPVFSATVELKNASNYDKTQLSNQKGQAYFAPLTNGTYTLLIQAANYDSYSGSVTINGQNVKIVNLHQIQ